MSEAIVCPYDTAKSTGTIYGIDLAITKEFFIYGQQYRIRQAGTILRCYFWLETIEGLSGLYIKIWRKNQNDRFDLVIKSENIAPSLSEAGFINYTFQTEMAVQPGDYYGILVEKSGTSGKQFRTQGSQTGVTTYFLNYSEADDVDYDWLASAGASTGVSIPVEMYMLAPFYVHIGDSLVAGHYGNFTFCETTDTTNLEIPFPSVLNLINGKSFQNMAIGNQKSSQILARFTADCINLNPTNVVILIGFNDINTGVEQSEYESNIEAMLSAVESKDSIKRCIIISILPSNNLDTTKSQARDAWNASLENIISSYPKASYFDGDSIIGIFREGGDIGNLWDIQPSFNEDGTHLTIAGYAAIGEALAASFADVSISMVSGVVFIADVDRFNYPTPEIRTYKVGLPNRKTFTHDPDALLDYKIDWSVPLGDDQIKTSQWIIPDGVEKIADFKTETYNVIWVRLKTTATKYRLTNRIESIGGRKDDSSISLLIEER